MEQQHQEQPTIHVIDDDADFCASMHFLISSAGLHVNTYPDARRFLDGHDPEAPGCVILDLRMPGMDGLELQRRLAERNSALPVIAVSAHADVPSAVQFMRQGAIEVLQKPFDDRVLLERIHAALAKNQSLRSRRGRESSVRKRIERLTPRERQVMDLVVAGRANKQAAAELKVSEKTIEVHRARVMQKMEADSLAELVRLCLTVKGDAVVRPV
jgi:two-component system, LuxR family, response regulator FixJ